MTCVNWSALTGEVVSWSDQTSTAETWTDSASDAEDWYAFFLGTPDCDLLVDDNGAEIYVEGY